MRRLKPATVEQRNSWPPLREGRVRREKPRKIGRIAVPAVRRNTTRGYHLQYPQDLVGAPRLDECVVAH
jgi:hypothetical protein